MRCAHARRLISNALSATLPAESAASLASHLARCPDCAEAQRADRAVYEALRQLPAVADPPPMPAALVAHLERVTSRPRWQTWFAARWQLGTAWAVGAAAGLLLGFVVGRGLWHRSPPPDRMLLAEAFAGFAPGGEEGP